MRHKYLPRFGSGVLQLAAALVALGGAACSDLTGPGGPRVQLRLDDAPAGDSLGQLGVGIVAAFRDSATLREMRVVTTPIGSTGGASTVVTAPYPLYARALGTVAYFPGDGRYQVQVTLTDTAGHTGTATFTRTVRVPGAAYTVTPLPDLGNGAGVRWVTAGGAVAGWVANGSGRMRPAVWRDGHLAVLPTRDTNDVVAARMNGAGDVLLERRLNYHLDPGYTIASGVTLLRADGTSVTVGPLGSDCCWIAADLNENRQAVGAGDAFYFARSAVVDAATLQLVDSVNAQVQQLNGRGHSMRDVVPYYNGLYSYRTLAVTGFTLPPLPGGPPLQSDCGYSPGHSQFVIRGIDLSDSDELLVAYCGSPAWLTAGRRVWLDRFFGRTGAIHLARQGDVVAALDSTGTIRLWRASTNRVVSVQSTGDAWTFDALAAVNGSGQVAAHGVDRATGRAAAVLLTPAVR